MQEKYILEKCEISKISISKEKFDIFYNEGLDKYSDEDYLYWDKIKYKSVPKGFKDNQELWGLIKIMRAQNIGSPIKTENGKYFKFGELAFSKELLHELDKNTSGTFFTNISETDKRLFIINGTLEEAISSSQLEGASTTTKNAKEMIQKGKKPTTKDEQMILNNYEAMNYIKNDLSNKELEIGDLLYLQSILTKDTIENDDIGRFRKDSDDIIVEFNGKIAHNPPNELFLNTEIKRLVDFANNKGNFNTFVHPIIRAILLHFWIGYLHPFCDGNGRTARALFYWYLLKNDYFGFSYIPLSSIIKESKIDYAKSYIYSEQDDLDVNYFINYNLRKIKIAFDKFKKNIESKFNKNHDNLKKLSHLEMNDRQKKLIIYFLENKDSFTTPLTHKNYYKISKGTAINDLKDLKLKGFLDSKKSGRNLNYFPVNNLDKLI